MSLESPVGLDRAMQKKILQNGMDCVLLLGRGQCHPQGGRERFERVERRDTLLERTTHVGPLVVDNQSHKSVKGSLPNCAKVM